MQKAISQITWHPSHSHYSDTGSTCHCKNVTLAQRVPKTLIVSTGSSNPLSNPGVQRSQLQLYRTTPTGLLLLNLIDWLIENFIYIFKIDPKLGTNFHLLIVITLGLVSPTRLHDEFKMTNYNRTKMWPKYNSFPPLTLIKRTRIKLLYYKNVLAE